MAHAFRKVFKERELLVITLRYLDVERKNKRYGLEDFAHI